MQLGTYLREHDSLAFEEILFEIPLRKEYTLAHIGLGKRVLDLGCLGGRFSLLIAERNNEVWGVEINPAAAAVAKSRGLRVKVADLEEGFPFADASFDVVHAGQTAEYLYDTKFFFTEAFRVLRPGGQLLMSVSNLNSLKNRIQVVTGGFLSRMGAYPEDHFGESIRPFNLHKIQDLCQQTGFQIEEIRGVPATLAPKPAARLLSGIGLIFPQLSDILFVAAQKMATDSDSD